jgi:predicted lipoprotein with Yx(FWY)xxD motif
MQRSGGRRARGLWAFNACLAIATATVTAGMLAVVTVGAGATAAAKGSTTAAVVVSTGDSAGATVLVAGHTVYALTASGTPCTAKCLKSRPPVLLPAGQSNATAGSGVDATKLGTAPAGHGRRQVTYAGKRLYRYAKDRAPGDVRGDVKDKWGTWSTVTVASGAAADPATTTPTTPETVAPDTTPPATAAPQTAPPETSPPATQPTTPRPTPAPSSGGGGVGF